MKTSMENQKVPKGSAAESHPSGCAERESTCCSLDCLTQPRFYCGQLLTDQDLTALVTWTKQKLALSRYLHGWGVVCGLHVSLGTTAGTVVIEPGYATSCCGEDILICEPHTIDLSGECSDLKDECTAQTARAAVKAGPVTEGGSDNPGKGYSPSGLDQLLKNATVVDLLIHYREEPSDLQAVLNRCGQGAECEASRTRETFRVERRHVEGETEHWPIKPDWPERYSKGGNVPVLSDYLAAYHGVIPTDAERALGWLQEVWMKAHPPRQFGFVRNLVREITTDKLQLPAALGEIFFWLVLEYRLEQLARGCWSCNADQGVPLARVRLATGVEGNRRVCQILEVNSHSPYRRPLGPDCWTAAPGCIHIGQLLWLPVAEAEALLRVQGMTVMRDEASVNYPLDLADRQEYIQGLQEVLGLVGPPTLCGPGVLLRWIKTPMGDDRVISARALQT